MYGEKFVVKMFNKSVIFNEKNIDEIDAYIWKQLDKHYNKFVNFNMVETINDNEVNIVTYVNNTVNVVGSIVGDMGLLEDCIWTAYLDDCNKDNMLISEYNDNIDDDYIYDEVQQIHKLLKSEGY